MCGRLLMIDPAVCGYRFGVIVQAAARAGKSPLPLWGTRPGRRSLASLRREVATIHRAKPYVPPDSPGAFPETRSVLSDGAAARPQP